MAAQQIEVIKDLRAAQLNFDEAFAVGEQLWDFGKVPQDDPRYTKPPNWVLTYRYAVRAMLARIVTVDRDYQTLNRLGGGEPPPEEMTTAKGRNWWNVIWESYAGSLFFAMDSSLECFAHAVNALGYLLSAADFIDITSDQKLKRVVPANLFDPPTKDNHKHSVYGACSYWFARICAHWRANRALVTTIIEYHDATKHRHAVVVGHLEGVAHFLKTNPKEPMEKVVFNAATGLVPHNNENSLQSLTADYRRFMVELLRITREELEAVFGQPLPAPAY